MAGRRGTKSGGSGVGCLILLAIGLVVTYWKQILLLVVVVGVAVCIYLVLKQTVKGLTERRLASRNSQQVVALPEPVQLVLLSQIPPERNSANHQAGDTSGETLAEVNQQIEKTPAALSEDGHIRTTLRPLPSVASQAKDESSQERVPRPLPMNAEELEAKLQKLEDIIRS